MNALRVRNWSQFQHFKDRRPPWIKLYRDLLDNMDYFMLSDRAAKCLPLVWLVASERDGLLPNLRELAFRLRLSEDQMEEVLSELSDRSFLCESDEADDSPKPTTAQQIAARNGFGSRHISDVTKREVWQRDGGKCKACGATEDIEYDHIHPVSKGGNSEPENLQLLCRPCNRRKRTRTAEQVATPAQPLRSLETEEEKESEKSRGKGVRADAFAVFWQTYPKKEGKGAAEKAFAKVDAPLETLLSAVKRQAVSPNWQKDGGRYIPMPATWLNQKRWEDEGVSVSITVPGSPERDPALKKLDEDAKKAAKPAPEVQARMDALLKGRVYQ